MSSRNVTFFIECVEDNTPSSMVHDIDNGSKSSEDNLENVLDGIQNVKTTGGSDNVADDRVSQDDTLVLRFIEKSNGDLAGEKNINCRQPTLKRLGASASEIVDKLVIPKYMKQDFSLNTAKPKRLK